MMSSAPKIQIGTQTVTLSVKVQGNTQVVEFDADIVACNGQALPKPQTIHVVVSCPTTRQVIQLVNGQPQTKTVDVTPQECVQNWLKLHEKIYSWR